MLNTDSEDYGGSGVLNGGTLTAEDEGIDGQPATLTGHAAAAGRRVLQAGRVNVITTAAAARAKAT